MSRIAPGRAPKFSHLTHDEERTVREFWVFGNHDPVVLQEVMRIIARLDNEISTIKSDKEHGKK